MSYDQPCYCEEIRHDKNGEPYILCRCPRPADWKPTLVYGVKQSEWQRISRRIIARDNHTCRYCGTTEGKMQCDHVVAFTRGGTNDDSNLVAACSDCNRSKGNRSLDEWKRRP